MTYIKLLTALAGLALLTACAGGITAVNNNVANCNTNAFHVDCKESDPAIMALRESQCLADTTIDPSCTAETPDDDKTGEMPDDGNEPVVDPCANGACVVNYADWLASPAGTGLATAPASTHTANGFLSGLTDTPPVATGFELGATQSFGSSLTLAYIGVGGGATDGASFFWGTFNSVPRYYAGIHASTDLGTPLDNISQAGIWNGWILANGRLNVNQKFDLTVTFNTASQGGTIAAFFGVGNPFFLDIDGAFNDKGVITTGTIVLGTSGDQATIADNDERTPGILTGLIGQQGAVGAFISTTNTINNNNMLGSYPYTGAFVAIPRTPDPEPLVINHGDWTRNFLPLFATPSTTPINQFLAGTTTLDPLTSVTPTLLTNAIGGVGFFTENDRYYAGLLSNTSLGAPVAITPQANGADVTAEWEGEIRGIGVFDSTGVDTTTAIDLDLTVNFTARTFTATRADPNADTTSITINGLFPATDNGVVTGNVSQRLEGVQFARRGLLTGLIGADGVVGAFYSQSTVAGEAYVGGFYAAPPDDN